MDLGLKNKSAWVIGASGTLGSRIALELAGAGARVYASSRSAESLAKLVGEARGQRAAALNVVTADITDPASVEAAAAHIAKDSGRLDILVNTTSLNIFGDFLELTDDDWEKVMQTKYLGYVRTIRAALPYMLKQRTGAIVNISGKGGRAPRDVHLPGSSVNAAINLLTKGLSNIYAKDGIRINAVAPGVIDSPRLEAIRNASISVNKLNDTSGDKVIRGSNALGRLGTAQEIADAVLFLLSDRSGFTTGTVLEVDGG